MSDPRFDVGLLDISDAARFLGIGRGRFHRWAHGYAHGAPLLDVVPAAPGRARVTFIAMAEAHVLEALSTAGVRPARVRPALNRLAAEFGHDYVLASRNLATDGIDVLWDFSRTSEGEGLMEGHTGQMVMREIVEDYLTYVTWADDGYPSMPAAEELPAVEGRHGPLPCLRAADLRREPYPGARYSGHAEGWRGPSGGGL